MGRKKRNAEKTKAVFRAGYSCPVDPDTTFAELDRIQTANEGLLRPADVVEESRPDEAPLHPVFTWDDYEAAEKWRQDEARRLIRSVCVVVESQPESEPRPVFIHTTNPHGTDEPGYRTVSSVVSDDDLRRQAVADAAAQLRGWQKRFNWLRDEFKDVFTAIDSVSTNEQ